MSFKNPMIAAAGVLCGCLAAFPAQAQYAFPAPDYSDYYGSVAASSYKYKSGTAKKTRRAERRVSVLVDGRPILFLNARPVSVDGRVLVPMREIFEKLGARVEWNAGRKQINAGRGSTDIRMQIGQSTATVNGRTVRLDQPPVLRQGSTLVPLRFVSEALGARVAWDAKNSEANITTR